MANHVFKYISAAYLEKQATIKTAVTRGPEIMAEHRDVKEHQEHEQDITNYSTYFTGML